MTNKILRKKYNKIFNNHILQEMNSFLKKDDLKIYNKYLEIFYLSENKNYITKTYIKRFSKFFIKEIKKIKLAPFLKNKKFFKRLETNEKNQNFILSSISYLTNSEKSEIHNIYDPKDSFFEKKDFSNILVSNFSLTIKFNLSITTISDLNERRSKNSENFYFELKKYLKKNKILKKKKNVF